MAGMAAMAEIAYYTVPREQAVILTDIVKDDDNVDIGRSVQP